MDHQELAQLLGNYGEFIGSIAVVATLFYLVLQVRQNTTSIRSQSRFHVLDSLISDMKSNLSQTPDELIGKVGGGEATLPEQQQFVWFWGAMLSNLELLYHELEEKALPESFSEPLRFRVATIVGVFPNAKLYWEAMRPLYTEPFRRYVESILPIADEILLASKPSQENPFDWFSHGIRGE